MATIIQESYRHGWEGAGADSGRAGGRAVTADDPTQSVC
jgi:hypothetical protein